MASKLGTILPAGGRSLGEAALTLTSEANRQRYDQTQKEAVHVGTAETRSTAALRAEVRKMLRSGELQAIATVLGVDPQYHELAAPHWRVLTDINWRDSTARRPVENSPLFHVLVYRREDYDKLVAPEVGNERSTIFKVVTTNQTLGARIRDEYNAAPEDIRNQWKTKTEAARWIRDRIDNGGEDKDKRRYVLQKLDAQLAIQFPNASRWHY
jgi:hypothetical protein